MIGRSGERRSGISVLTARHDDDDDDMDKIKLFDKNQKELETLNQAVSIYSQERGMEFGIKKNVPC